MTLVNVGSEDIRLTSIQSDSFDAVEVHEMAMVDGLMEMREITNLVIPAQTQVTLAPGGMHLMLKGPRQHFESGQRLDMVLNFESGEEQIISILVAAR
jgi:copper(I)-binding protein